MNYQEATDFYNELKSQFKKQLFVSLHFENKGQIWLKVRQRGGAPHNPAGALFSGPPVWVRSREEWPAIAAENFGFKVPNA